MLTKGKLLAGAAGVAALFGSTGLVAAEVKAAAYADLRFGLDYFEDKNSANPSDVNFENHGSFWGARGSATEGGITVFGAYERWLDADAQAAVDLVRQSYAGVTTAFGTVQYGTFATAYMESGRKLDPFFATGAAGVGQPTATFFGGQSHGLSSLTADSNPTFFGVGGFVSNQVAYTSPTLFGLTVNAAVMFDDASGPNEQDDYAAGLEWAMADWGVNAGVQYLDANNATNTGLAADEEALRVYGGLNQKRFGVNVSGERIDLVGTAAHADYVMLSAWFGVLDGTRIAASAGQENETGAEGDSFRLGVFHDVVDNFTAHVVYRNFNSTDGTLPDDQVISLGASYRFELSGTTTTR